MKKNTLDDYKQAIRKQYAVARNDTFSSFLEEPSPAQLRNFCLMLFDNGLTLSDENIFRIFFQVGKEGDLRKAIDTVEPGRFKPVISFLKGENETRDLTKVELAAILVNCEARPYQKYVKKSVSQPEVLGRENVILNQKETIWVGKNNEAKPVYKQRLFLVILVLAFTGLTAFGLRSIFLEKRCMLWKEDHYEAISCDDQPQGIIGISTGIIPRNDLIIENMHKIKVTPKTTFFRNGQPIIWYNKNHGRCEYFTYPGLHPVSGKTLRPITRTIINNHVK
jgi:hypothetical protein